MKATFRFFIQKEFSTTPTPKSWRKMPAACTDEYTTVGRSHCPSFRAGVIGSGHQR
ncbi:MAG: hypothetical protein AAF573_04895 [Bacteroidota bacterium]